MEKNKTMFPRPLKKEEGAKLMKKPMSKEREEMSHTDPIGKIISELLLAGPRIHMIHLKTESFAAHSALDEFYKAAPGFADSIIEQYQGATEKLVEYPKEVDMYSIDSVQEAIEYLRHLYHCVSMAQEVCEHSEIINEFDNIKSQINKTKYKLIFLK